MADTLNNRVPSFGVDTDGTPNATIITGIISLNNVWERVNLVTGSCGPGISCGWLNASEYNGTIPTGSTVINITVLVRWGNRQAGRGAGGQNISIHNTTNWFRCAGPFGESPDSNTTCFFTGTNLTGNFTTVDSVNSMNVSFIGKDTNGGSQATVDIDVMNITVYYVPPPSAPSFNIAFPTTYEGSFNETINSACSSENACPTANNITFNFTNLYQDFIEPMTNGQTANQQAGPTKPIFLIYNTGNVDEQIGINTSTPAGFYTCANSTCVGGECTAMLSTCTNISSPGYLYLGTVNQGKRMNITLYANVTNPVAGTYQTYTYVNATG